jgi:hypothetical protein
VVLGGDVAFRMLQCVLTTAPVLQLPTLDHDLIIECDASSCFSVVLHQGSGPVVFFSKSITPWLAKIMAYEHELIGFVYPIRHWCPYLWGHPFLIRTENYSLKFLLDQKLATIPLPQWVSKLLSFDFRVKYKPGVTNVVADALSRRDSEAGAELLALSVPNFHIFDTLRQEIGHEPDLRRFREEVLADTHGTDWWMVDDMIMVVSWVYATTTLPVLFEAPANTDGVGHEAVEHMLQRLRAVFHIPGECTTVQEQK